MKKQLDELKIKVSKKDKNLIGLLVLTETALRSVINMADKKSVDFQYVRMSDDKKDFYQYIYDLLNPVLSEVSNFNTKINDEYLKIYSKSEMNTMMDSVLACLDMLENQDPKQIQAVMKKFGWKGAEAFWEKHSLKNEKKGT
ncbi:MAG TPA: hypothetical protein PLD55_12425 [bacterium]|nr:hypothetical protein [bacterium]